MRENPDYRVLPALFEIEKKFEQKTRIKVYQVANMSNSVKHVTLAIDIHRHLKKSELFDAALFPGCKIIGVSGASADFSDEEGDEEDDNCGEGWGDPEWGHAGDLGQNVGTGLTTDKSSL